jgi:hypothetical protein
MDDMREIVVHVGPGLDADEIKDVLNEGEDVRSP